jgi:hypothetical protein
VLGAVPLLRRNKKPPGISAQEASASSAGARRQVRRRPKALFSIAVNIGIEGPKVKT